VPRKDLPLRATEFGQSILNRELSDRIQDLSKRARALADLSPAQNSFAHTKSIWRLTEELTGLAMPMTSRSLRPGQERPWLPWPNER
jgi:hypothetical protein